MTLIVTVALCLYQLSQAASGEASLLAFFVSAWTAMMLFNLYDLLILDWIVFNFWQPAWLVLPGTESMSGYRDFRFHFIGFLKGTVLITLVAGVVALIAWALQ